MLDVNIIDFTDIRFCLQKGRSLHDRLMCRGMLLSTEVSAPAVAYIVGIICRLACLFMPARMLRVLYPLFRGGIGPWTCSQNKVEH